jgi:pimeloyl-ACP methyl ester carboxylesterase
MESFFISYRVSSFHVVTYGRGANVIFCFHGYGENADSYGIFEELLGNRYKLVAIEMPFHGKTTWRGPLLLEVAGLITVMNEIQGSTSATFSVMGYSMGGRVALRLLQEMPERIEKLVLIAPDGLHKNFWQRIANQSFVGNQLFKFTMRHPGWLFGLLKIGFTLKLLNSNMEKFLRYYLDEEAERLILYKRWTTMRKFRPTQASLQQIIQSNKTPVHLFFGKYDRIIVSKWGYLFANTLPTVTVKEIAAGHILLQQKYVSEIASPFMEE